MSDKPGGDVSPGNASLQGNAAFYHRSLLGIRGAGIVDSMGGSGTTFGAVSQHVNQNKNQNQSNSEFSGDSGDDNVHANTNINA